MEGAESPPHAHQPTITVSFHPPPHYGGRRDPEVLQRALALAGQAAVVVLALVRALRRSG